MKTTIPQFTVKEQAIIRIIADSIIFQRIANSMVDILSVVNPSKVEEFEPEHKYYGVTNAVDLLGITSMEDAELRDSMFDEYVRYAYDKSNTESSEALAQSLYFDWLRKIKDHYTSRKAS